MTKEEEDALFLVVGDINRRLTEAEETLSKVRHEVGRTNPSVYSSCPPQHMCEI